jgi:hypothetical protein
MFNAWPSERRIGRRMTVIFWRFFGEAT